MSWMWLNACPKAPSAARGILTSCRRAPNTSALCEGWPASVRSMWPTSWAMRPSRTSDSTALAETNRVCRSDVDFDAPMIAMRAISAVTGSRRASPLAAYFSVTSSNAALTFRVPPLPDRSMTTTSTSFSRRRPMINLQGRLRQNYRNLRDGMVLSFDKIVEKTGFGSEEGRPIALWTSIKLSKRLPDCCSRYFVVDRVAGEKPNDLRQGVGADE